MCNFCTLPREEAGWSETLQMAWQHRGNHRAGRMFSRQRNNQQTACSNLRTGRHTRWAWRARCQDSRSRSHGRMWTSSVVVRLSGPGKVPQYHRALQVIPKRV